MIVDNELAASMYGSKLLDYPTYSRICALNEKGRQNDAFEQWFRFATSNYTEESINVLSDCLKKVGKGTRPRLIKVSNRMHGRCTESDL